jgi:hypothetical protein
MATDSWNQVFVMEKVHVFNQINVYASLDGMDLNARQQYVPVFIRMIPLFVKDVVCVSHQTLVLVKMEQVVQIVPPLYAMVSSRPTRLCVPLAVNVLHQTHVPVLCRQIQEVITMVHPVISSIVAKFHRIPPPLVLEQEHVFHQIIVFVALYSGSDRNVKTSFYQF